MKKLMRILYYKLRLYKLISDHLYIKILFRIQQGYSLNLKNPKTLNEKIQWLKLYRRMPLCTLCADKYLVRDYIKEKIGEQYLIPLEQVLKSADEIDLLKLPDYPFIIKTNHDSGTYFIVKNKTKQDWNLIRKKLKIALGRNFYYYRDREWQYKNIKPLVVVEKLLTNSEGNVP